MILKLQTFVGEIPRLPGHLLPDNAAQLATNCDFAHGELRGLRNSANVDSITPLNGERITDVWTDDGQNFFGWPWPVDVVKSQVPEDIYHRIFYTGLPGDGPIIKVARTHRNDEGTLTPVIGTNIVGGQYRPPEASNVGFGGNNLGPDSWVLGIPPPKVQNVSEDDVLVASLADRKTWPGVPGLKLRVTFCVEDPAGKIVYQQDVSNAESAYVPGDPSKVYPQVAWTNDTSQRGNKIQDMLWPLNGYAKPAPYKFYFMEPPDLDTLPIGRTVTIKNTSTGGTISIPYSTSVVDPLATPVSNEQA